MIVLLHIDNYAFAFIILFIILIVFGPPITLLIIGIKKYRNEATKDRATIFFILAAVYLLIGFGFCGGVFS